MTLEIRLKFYNDGLENIIRGISKRSGINSIQANILKHQRKVLTKFIDDLKDDPMSDGHKLNILTGVQAALSFGLFGEVDAKTSKLINELQNQMMAVARNSKKKKDNEQEIKLKKVIKELFVRDGSRTATSLKYAEKNRLWILEKLGMQKEKLTKEYMGWPSASKIKKAIQAVKKERRA